LIWSPFGPEIGLGSALRLPCPQRLD
jgi:hypothetical protein